MNSVFILVFLIMAPSLIRRQMRGVPWDWRPWASLAITALLGAVTVFPVLCGKHLPVALVLPEPVPSAAMVVLFMLALSRPVWEALDELRRRRDRGPSSDDRPE